MIAHGPHQGCAAAPRDRPSRTHSQSETSTGRRRDGDDGGDRLDGEEDVGDPAAAAASAVLGEGREQGRHGGRGDDHEADPAEGVAAHGGDRGGQHERYPHQGGPRTGRHAAPPRPGAQSGSAADERSDTSLTVARAVVKEPRRPRSRVSPTSRWRATSETTAAGDVAPSGPSRETRRTALARTVQTVRQRRRGDPRQQPGAQRRGQAGHESGGRDGAAGDRLDDVAGAHGEVHAEEAGLDEPEDEGANGGADDVIAMRRAGRFGRAGRWLLSCRRRYEAGRAGVRAASPGFGAGHRPARWRARYRDGDPGAASWACRAVHVEQVFGRFVHTE